jgi:hypothetical protein
MRVIDDFNGPAKLLKNIEFFSLNYPPFQFCPPKQNLGSFFSPIFHRCSLTFF